MKKSVIATGAASLALAAMPVVGVFAAGNTLTDHIEVNVPAACSITNHNTDTNGTQANLENWYKKEIFNGQYAEINGSNSDPTHTPAADNTVGVTCNSTATSGTSTSWKLTAVGAGAEDHETDLWSGTAAIPSSTETTIISAEQGNAGNVSDWSFKVKIASPATPAANFSTDTYYPIPAEPRDVATGNGTAAEGTFEMNYGVYVSGTQASGTYTGAVTYTLINPSN